MNEGMLLLRQEVDALRRDLREASLTDSLTGLRNRRFFSVTIDDDLERVRRAFSSKATAKRNRDLLFYLVDIDAFSEVNELVGPQEGDRLLGELAKRIAKKIRRSDSIIRWGGEEFLLVCRNCDRAEARIVADRILSAVSNQPLDVGGGRLLRRSCSIGWTPFPWLPDDPEALQWEDVLRLATRALHLAKKSGRNQALGLLPSDFGADSLKETRAAIDNPLESGDWSSIRLVRSSGREEPPPC
jgi:diguanylate cyclase (GGDEF)-like protein